MLSQDGWIRYFNNTRPRQRPLAVTFLGRDCRKGGDLRLTGRNGPRPPSEPRGRLSYPFFGLFYFWVYSDSEFLRYPEYTLHYMVLWLKETEALQILLQIRSARPLFQIWSIAAFICKPKCLKSLKCAIVFKSIVITDIKYDILMFRI